MILVAGGTGRLGTVLVRRLTERGEHVRVLTRSRDRASHLPDGVDVVTGDVRDRGSVEDAVGGVDTVVSAVHGFIGPRGVSPTTVDRDGNANLVAGAAGVGADLVMLSVVGASPGSPMELFRMKHAAEQHALASAVPTTVVRATAFMELWIELLRQTAGRTGRPLVFGRGDNPINFVSVEDVAAIVDRAISDQSTRGTVLEVGGPENLTFNELARAVEAADGRTAEPRHVPPVMLHVLAATIGRIKPQLGRQARAGLAMDGEDLAFDSHGPHDRFPDLPRTSVVEVLAGDPP